MKKPKLRMVQCLVIGFMIFSLSACQERVISPTALSTASHINNYPASRSVTPFFHTATPVPTQTQLPSATVSSPPTQSVPWTPVPLSVIEWIRYEHDKSGVTVEYPSDWCTIHLRGDEDWNEYTDYHISYFGPPECESWRGLVQEYPGVILEIYRRPLQSRSVTDPHTWQPNEGGCKVQWERPVSVPNAEGLQFVWASDDFDGPCRTVMTIYYSQSFELEIRLSTDIPPAVWEKAISEGFEEAVASDYAILDYMSRSIRIVR
jgi:hypothetical protein